MDSKPIYKTAAELDIEQWEHDGLVALVGPLSRGELPFDMDRGHVAAECGTPRCIGGWMCSFASRKWGDYSKSCWSLFWPKSYVLRNASSTQAARAIVKFLVTGDPQWDRVMAGAA